ncbi:Ig-like domain-containing protein [Vibrio coralliilyticus]|uniref:Ig-like domain-containing protein n=1 Tax=Vibrio coralliilyticus TaxID=190893 RepID=UPI0015617131|nr:Ig-like domain-containing protein [Vibrio coralliilyticus]NRF26295.1 Ig-like domain-containing protein [Vibrio coralliilyticus]NRF80486.1 Ig-like domain-containing protein [Vibrio coralliilyticus]
MRKLNILAVSLSAALILAGCDGEESTTENIAVEVPFALNDIPMPNDGYGYDDDGSISLPDEPSSPQSYSTNEEYEAYYQSFETSYAAVDGWGLCVEPIEIPLDSVNSGQVPAIDSSSLEGNVLLLDSSGNEIDGTKLTSDGRQLTIQCGAALQPGTPYYLAVTNGVKTTQGTPLQPSSGFTQLLNTDPSELDEHEQWLQTTTQEAVDLYHTTGNQHSLVYASKFTTQNSYSVIDNVIKQTLADTPEILWDEVKHDPKGDPRNPPAERHVVVSAHLKSNNYLSLTQENATKEKCKLDIYDPVTSCPSMYKWMTGANGEHLTQRYFETTNEAEKIFLHNDETTLVPVDFYLPYIPGETDTVKEAIKYITKASNPAVLFIHGITGSKDDARLIAKKYVTEGQKYVFAAIDMPYHGMRTVCDSSDYIDDDPNSYCPGGGKPISARADKSYFINITSPLALRANLHQSVSDFIGLRWAMNFGVQNADREAHLVGVSLGGIMSVMTTEATYGPNQTDPIRGLKFDTSNFVVPGQGLVNVVLSSLTLSSEMEESVKKSADVQRAIAETLIPNLCTVETSNEECITQLNAHSEQLNDSIEMLEDEIYNALIPILKHGVQQTIDGSDPAGKVTRQREAKQSTLLIEAKGTCRGTCEIGDYMPDTVVPNSADNNTMTGTEPLIRALGLEPILDSENDPNGLRGVIRATVGGHGTFLFPYEGPMDETGLPSTSDLDDVEASRQTQQDAVLEMIQTKGEDITLDATDKENIIDINDFDDVAHSEEVN